jgi:hypothetical protein
VEITVYEDRSFAFELKTPPASRMLLKAAGVQKGSSEPHKTKVAKVSWDQVREIAEFKKADLNANDVDQAAKIIAGTARSMGITVECANADRPDNTVGVANAGSAPTTRSSSKRGSARQAVESARLSQLNTFAWEGPLRPE